MNFLNFLTAGASLFNFNLQNLASSSALQQNQGSLSMSVQDKTAEPTFGQPAQIPAELTVKMKQEMEVLTQQQQLINQYMHLNIQLLSQKLENLEKIPLQEKAKYMAASNMSVTTPVTVLSRQQNNSQQQKNTHKKNKKINKCGHDDKQHYAKGLCNNCYHKYGRTKKPWNCPHQKLYAAGMCQNCYINNYNRKKRMTKDGPGEQYEEQEQELKIEESQFQRAVEEPSKRDAIERGEHEEKDKGQDNDKEKEMEKEKDEQ